MFYIDIITSKFYKYILYIDVLLNYIKELHDEKESFNNWNNKFAISVEF
jgi:hypothetical protein